MKSLYLYEETFKMYWHVFSTVHVYAKLYTLQLLTLTYIICINHKQWAISLSNKKKLLITLERILISFLYPYFKILLTVF